MRKLASNVKYGLCLTVFFGFLISCTSDNPIADSSQSPDPTVSDFPIAFVKRPIPVDENDNFVPENINEPDAFNPGAVLYIKDRALPSAPERDITTQVFIDPNDPDTVPLYDVKDLSISPDGLKMIFAMRAPEIPNADDDDQPKWNIWEYDLETDSLRRVISSDIVAEDGHDVMPSYLADGRIVFSSTRQRQSKAILLDEGKPQYEGQEESLNADAFVLHVMNDDGSDIQQITFNQSHDFYPTLLRDGRIAFLRWDNMGNANSQSLYTIHPDGTNLQRLYGYHSQNTGNNGARAVFAKPLPMPDDSLLVLSKPQQSMTYGGDPLVIDTENFIEADQMVDGSAGTGQVSIAANVINTDNTPSPGGLFHSVSPLWDNTEDRILISWSPCLLREVDSATGEETQHPCTEENLVRYANNELLVSSPSYGIWMWQRGTSTQTPIVIAEQGFWLTEPVIFQERLQGVTYIPDAIPGVDVDQDLVSENVGVLHIRSVYDLDGTDSTPTGIAAMADPVQTSPATRPARFLRLVKAVPIPDDDIYDFDNSAFGRSRNQLMREILGYVPVEPDGSVMVKVPANVPFTISILDQYGQRINPVGTGSPRHQHWLQLRLGEVKECSGCHTRTSEVSHGRADADPPSVYPGSLGNSTFPNSNPAVFADDGETMAQAKARFDADSDMNPDGPPAPNLDIQFSDFWTDPNVTTPAPDIAYLYQDLQTPAPITSACASGWYAGCRIVINYEEHIQPIWELPRITYDTDGMTVLQDDTCVTCHSLTDDMGQAKVPDGQLELTNLPSTDEPNHMRGYRELFFNDNIVDVVNGAVVDQQFPVVLNVQPYVNYFLFQTLDANGQVIFFADDDGNFIYEPDPNTGLPTELQDTDGTTIYQIDAQGNQLTDANGQLIPIAIPVPEPNQVTETRLVQNAPILSTNGARASSRFMDLFRTGSHQGRLSDAELRLIAEWLDIGAQYFNNPFLAPEN